MTLQEKNLPKRKCNQFNFNIETTTKKNCIILRGVNNYAKARV